MRDGSMNRVERLLFEYERAKCERLYEAVMCEQLVDEAACFDPDIKKLWLEAKGTPDFKEVLARAVGIIKAHEGFDEVV